MMLKKVVIHSDGVSRGNPGPAAIGAIIRDERGRLLASISQRIGRATNNQAEYRAIIAALEKVLALGARQVELNSDSELVVRQIKGQYRVRKEALRPLYQRVKQLQNRLEGFTVRHIPRQQNREADKLANAALNLVAGIGLAERYRLIIKLRQNIDEAHDIAHMHKIIDTLRDFPGQDEVSLAIDYEKKFFSLTLSNIHVNYCHELRERLVEMVGKRGLRIERI